MHHNPHLTEVAGGTFASIIPNIHSEDLLRTVVLAAVGALVSLAVSSLFKYLVNRIRRRK